MNQGKENGEKDVYIQEYFMVKPTGFWDQTGCRRIWMTFKFRAKVTKQITVGTNEGQVAVAGEEEGKVIMLLQKPPKKEIKRGRQKHFCQGEFN